MSVIVATGGVPPGKTQVRFAARACTNPQVQMALYWANGDISDVQAQAIEGFPTVLPDKPKGPGKKPVTT